jgi:hypothetical protein
MTNVALAPRRSRVYLSQPVELSRQVAPGWGHPIESIDDVAWDASMGLLDADGWELVLARRGQGATRR